MSRIEPAVLTAFGGTLIYTFSKELIIYRRTSQQFGIELDLDDFIEIYGVDALGVTAGLFCILLAGFLKFKK